uniref:Secreted protein n=1 Tax=Meloidogyne floridensis TaxID=298350 RepID=A0A915P1B8_9BILA
MIISSFILIHLLLFFGEILPRDLLVKGMKNGSNRGEPGPSRQSHPEKIRAGRQVLKHESNEISLTELSFLIRILEEVQENELEQNVYSIQQILFEKGIDILRGQEILDPTRIAHLIEGNRNNMNPALYEHLVQENQEFMNSEQNHYMDDATSGQILQTIGKISSKIRKLILVYENKLNDAMNVLNSNLGNVEDKIGKIISRYYELTDELNELAKANQSLKKNIGNFEHNNQRIKKIYLIELLNQTNPFILHNLLNELLAPTQLEKNIYIFYNLLGVARALTSMFLSNAELTNFYPQLLGVERKELDVEKYQQVCTNYENKIDQAMNKLKMPGKNYANYFFNIALQLVNQILTETFPKMKSDMAYENVYTIGYYLGIIFTKNDESAAISVDYADEDVEDYEYHVPKYYTDDEDV